MKMSELEATAIDEDHGEKSRGLLRAILRHEDAGLAGVCAEWGATESHQAVVDHATAFICDDCLALEARVPEIVEGSAQGRTRVQITETYTCTETGDAHASTAVVAETVRNACLYAVHHNVGTQRCRDRCSELRLSPSCVVVECIDAAFSCVMPPGLVGREQCTHTHTSRHQRRVARDNNTPAHTGRRGRCITCTGTQFSGLRRAHAHIHTTARPPQRDEPARLGGERTGMRPPGDAAAVRGASE